MGPQHKPKQAAHPRRPRFTRHALPGPRIHLLARAHEHHERIRPRTHWLAFAVAARPRSLQPHSTTRSQTRTRERRKIPCLRWPGRAPPGPRAGPAAKPIKPAPRPRPPPANGPTRPPTRPSAQRLTNGPVRQGGSRAGRGLRRRLGPAPLLTSTRTCPKTVAAPPGTVESWAAPSSAS